MEQSTNSLPEHIYISDLNDFAWDDMWEDVSDSIFKNEYTRTDLVEQPQKLQEWDSIPKESGHYWFSGWWNTKTEVWGTSVSATGIKLVYLVYYDGHPEFYIDDGDYIFGLVGKWHGPLVVPSEVCKV